MTHVTRQVNVVSMLFSWQVPCCAAHMHGGEASDFDLGVIAFDGSPFELFGAAVKRFLGVRA